VVSNRDIFTQEIIAKNSSGHRRKCGFSQEKLVEKAVKYAQTDSLLKCKNNASMLTTSL